MRMFECTFVESSKIKGSIKYVQDCVKFVWELLYIAKRRG